MTLRTAGPVEDQVRVRTTVEWIDRCTRVDVVVRRATKSKGLSVRPHDDLACSRLHSPQ